MLRTRTLEEFQVMPTNEFIDLAKEAEKQALAEPKEARTRREKYLGKLDYDLLQSKQLATSKDLFRIRLIDMFTNENYAPHSKFEEYINSVYATNMHWKASHELTSYIDKSIIQGRTRITIAKSTVELFDLFYAILFWQTDTAKQKEQILQLEQKLLALKNMYIKANQDKLLGDPVVKMATIDETIVKGLSAMRSYVAGDSESMKRSARHFEVLKTAFISRLDKIQLLKTMMGAYPTQICRWVADVFFAARNNVNLESISVRVKTEIEAELKKGEFQKLREAANLSLKAELPTEAENDEQPGSELASNIVLVIAAKPAAESKSFASSHAVARAVLSAEESKEQTQKARHDKYEERKENAVYTESESKVKVSVPSKSGDYKDQKSASAFSASGSTVMKAPGKSPTPVASPLARNGAQVLASRPAG